MRSESYMFTRKCRKCGSEFSTENDRTHYCERHRKREKPLRKIEYISDCEICQKMLQECEAELEALIDKIEGTRNGKATEIERSRQRYMRAVRRKFPKPSRYRRYTERLEYREAEMLAAKGELTMKSIAEMTGFHRTTVRRHLAQHLVPLGYLKRNGRTIDTGVRLGRSFPRYSLHFVPEKTRWLPPVGYFGFTETDIERHEEEFRELDHKLKLVSEELMVFWLRTRLGEVEKTMLDALESENLDVEERGVMLYAARLVTERILKEVLSDYAPTLSESGRNLEMFKPVLSRIARPVDNGEDVDLPEIQRIASKLDSRKDPLLKKRWVMEQVNDIFNFMRHRLIFDAPTVIIDWKHD
ncbi:MAG: hypothetical protein V3V98_03365 [Thermoplasmata archaeon]